MRKPLRFLKNQLINAILMVALTVPLLVVAVSLDHNPTLSFEGARIQLVKDADGELSAQLLFDVCVSNLDYTNGVQFTLNFNPQYLEPSDYKDNAPLCGSGIFEEVHTDKEFKANPGLYYADNDGNGVAESVSPFGTPPEKNECTVLKGRNTAQSFLYMYLMIDDALTVDPAVNDLMVSLPAGMEDNDKMNVLKASEKLVLGTLSFRVVDLDLLPTITAKFNGLVDVVFEDNHAKDKANEKLICFTNRATREAEATPWGIGYPKGTDRDRVRAFYNDISNDRDARATFTYLLPRTIIKARAAEAELTINAYQAYTAGVVSDIDAALQRYSPAITVTYSDGSEGNFIMPWGRTGDTVDGLDWKATKAYDWGTDNWRDENGDLKPDWKAPLTTEPKKQVVDNETDPTTQIEYDPTASRYKWPGNDNQRYLVQKNFCYKEEDFNGVERNKEFPLPIDVRLTVTPITLIDVTADDLRRSYLLNDALVDGVTAVQSVGALKLPIKARLITDVPAGGVTLTMDIPGWSHLQDYTVDGVTETRYWPSEKVTDPGTSAVLSGTGDTVVDLWNDRATDETEGGYLHWPTIDDKGKWADPDNGAYLGTNRAGDYTFKMAEAYGGKPKYFTRIEIQTLYPWLTVPDNDAVEDDIEAWPIDDATRTIVWNDDPTPPEDPDDPPKKKLVDTINYQVSYVSTVVNATNTQPEFTLEVRKVDPEHDLPLSLPKGSIFRIKLPDGTEMAVGYTKSGEGVDQGGNWYADNDGSYKPKDFKLVIDGSETDNIAFNLTSNPGDPTQNSYGDEREKLRRYINLGGWFSVAVKEIEKDNAGVVTSETLWSDFIPVYVPPRDNYYTQSKVYNFIGNNAGLYPWPGGVSTTVILPPGTYNPVDASGEPTYVNSQGDPVSAGASDAVRAVERYDLTTTYDGATGAQPGRLSTFTIDPIPAPDPNDDWQKTPSVVAGKNITTYGPEFFLDSAVYSAYGKVLNKLTDRSVDPKGYHAVDAKTATIRVEETAQPEEEEKIILEYVETHGGERSIDYDDTYGYDPEYRERYNVSNVIFETKTQGYTMRQDYVLRIRNVGNVDISGLSIDFLTDLVGNPVYDKELDSDPAGGHFELLQAPASFLPAGESTTFVLTYVYNLKAKPNGPMNYRDKLFITSNSKHAVGVYAYDKYHDAGTADKDKPYLLDFDAQFQVTNSDIYRVTVRYLPNDGCMGTANVIIGLTNPSDLTSMNTAAGPTAYPKGVPVYILISPDDEYTMVNVWAENTAIPAVRVPIGPYDNDSNPGSSGHLPDNDKRMVYVFEMPAHDTTVTVVFNEPISSKLRLSDLRVYRDLDHDTTETPDDLYPHNTKWDDNTDSKYKANYEELPIWQKSFTDAEKTAAAAYIKGDNTNLYLMTKGEADKPGSRPNFDDTVEQYLVVLPFEADWAQVEVDLREVKYIFNGTPITNLPLENIYVQMTLYDSMDMLPQPQTPELIFSSDSNVYPTDYPTGTPYAGYRLGETNGPTTHTSIPFLSPTPGTSKYVRVQLSYTEDTVTTTRAYYIEIHRAPEKVNATLNYGNSPYGMIMNDTVMTAANKDVAKTTFVSNNYTFNGMAPGLVPRVVTENGLTDIHYWLEAWAEEPTENWTAPNADWNTPNAYSPDPSAPPSTDGVYDAETGMSWDLYQRVHQPDVNLDLNDYAFFAIMGETFRDPGIARATDSSGRTVDLNKAILSLTVYTLDNSTGVVKDTPDDQLTRFTLPDPSAAGVPSGDDTADVKARTVTIGFIDNNDGTPAASGDIVKADWATWYRNADNELTQENGEGNTLLELRPGRYRLVYTFPDYNYIPDDAVYGNKLLTVTRDFVVLAPVGDVNADLTVKAGTNSDESLMEGRISPDAGYPALGYMADNYDYSAIFKLRTCDVNNDRNINNIDANAILRSSGVERFYLPVKYKPATGTP